MDAIEFLEKNIDKYEVSNRAIKDIVIRISQLEFMLEDYHKAKLKELTTLK